MQLSLSPDLAPTPLALSKAADRCVLNAQGGSRSTGTGTSALQRRPQSSDIGN